MKIYFQYNTKVSIPFIMSTNNYGILWDNYSQSKYGDPRDYKDLNQFALYNKEGKEGSLTATYTQKDQALIVRQESAIDYENLTTIKKFPAGFRFNDGSIVWEGSIVAHQTDTYKFSLYYAGYTKVWAQRFVDSARTLENFVESEYLSIHFSRWKKVKAPKSNWNGSPTAEFSYIGLKALSSSPLEKSGNISFWSEMGEQDGLLFHCWQKHG